MTRASMRDVQNVARCLADYQIAVRRLISLWPEVNMDDKIVSLVEGTQKEIVR
jgi:hypothetical protein